MLSNLCKRHRLIIISTILLTTILLFTACEDKSTQDSIIDKQNELMISLGYTNDLLETIQKNETPFVGDNSRVGAIVSVLPVSWKGLSFDSFSLDTLIDDLPMCLFPSFLYFHGIACHY